MGQRIFPSHPKLRGDLRSSEPSLGSDIGGGVMVAGGDSGAQHYVPAIPRLSIFATNPRSHA
jgi:hypothetical protein